MSTYIVFDGMVEKSSVSAFQNFLRIENPLNIKEVMSTNVYVICIDCVDIHSIDCIIDPCLVSTVSTYIVFDGMVEKASVSAFQNFLQIENPLNIKKVMGRNVWMCFDSNINSLDKHSIQCIACFDLCINSVDKQDTILNTQ